MSGRAANQRANACHAAGGLDVVDDTLTLPIVLTPHSPGVILVNARRDGLSQVFQIEVGK